MTKRRDKVLSAPSLGLRCSLEPRPESRRQRAYGGRAPFLPIEEKPDGCEKPLLEAPCTNLARTLTGRYEVGDVLDELDAMTVRGRRARRGVGVSLGEHQTGTCASATASVEAVRRLEEDLRRAVAARSSWAAYQTGVPTLIGDIGPADQWPRIPRGLPARWQPISSPASR